MGSQQWHEWRAKGVGSSDAPIVLGISPYKTPRMLYDEKLGLAPADSGGSFVTDMGHKFETHMRAQVELQFGMDFPPALVEHASYPHIRASLDGYNRDQNIFVEIKMIGKTAFKDLALKLRPKDEHFAQVQHQFLVTGARMGIYAAYILNDEMTQIDQTIVIELAPDFEFIRGLKGAIDEFWDRVLRQDPPPLTPKDRVEVSDPEALYFARRFAKAKRISDKMSEIMKHARQKLLDMTPHPNAIVGPVHVLKVKKLKAIRVLKKP